MQPNHPRRIAAFLLILAGPLFAAWNPPAEAELIFLGEILEVQTGPVGMSEPPLHTWRVQVQVSEAFRGQPPETLTLHYAYRGNDVPVLQKGQRRVFAAQSRQDALSIMQMPLAAEVDLESLREPSFPGWTRGEDGSWISPWGDGRAPRTLPAGLAFSIAPLPPAREIQWTNPDGDGWYTLTVQNNTEEVLEIPALPTRGGEVLWTEAVLLSIQEKTYTLPGSGKGLEGAAPLRLAPGEKASGTVHAIAIDGPEWPRGGYRIGLNFILGDQVRSHSFYYMSRHHDSMRTANP